MIYLALSRFCRSSFAHFPIEHVALAGHHCKIRNNAIRSKTVTELFFSLIYNANGQMDEIRIDPTFVNFLSIFSRILSFIFYWLLFSSAEP